MKRIIVSLTLLLFIVSLEGCTYIAHYKQFVLLKRLGDNQREIEEYLDTQKRLFYKLKDDVLNNRLTKGLPGKKILSVYGRPVFCRSSEGGCKIKETCFYRHPTHYFYSDMIYLNFDINRCLISWGLIKAK
ncbi:MAG: hypothetical protein PHC37_06590 [Candidatus Omnitrophica bacterium]|nr:hypothetical protein [Candidatus Omnitrophota bacterium]